MSYDYCGKVVHRPSRIGISSVLKSSGDRDFKVKGGFVFVMGV